MTAQDPPQSMFARSQKSFRTGNLPRAAPSDWYTSTDDPLLGLASFSAWAMKSLRESESHACSAVRKLSRVHVQNRPYV